MTYIKNRKPTSPGVRHRIDLYNDYLFRGKPLKKLTKGSTKISGRNNRGQITTRHRGQGNKQNSRIKTFLNYNNKGLVLRVEYDPKTNCHLSLVKWYYYEADSPRLSYLPAESKTRAGDQVYVNPNFITKGSVYGLGRLPEGEKIFGVELFRGSGPKLARSAGMFCKLLKHNQDRGTSVIELPSKARKELRSDCLATLGEASNSSHHLIKLGKAGRNRWKGFRPTVRGEAMNAVDHPHGGNSAGGGPPRTPWGKLAKWVPSKL